MKTLMSSLIELTTETLKIALGDQDWMIEENRHRLLASIDEAEKKLQASLQARAHGLTPELLEPPGKPFDLDFVVLHLDRTTENLKAQCEAVRNDPSTPPDELLGVTLFLLLVNSVAAQKEVYAARVLAKIK